MKYLLIIIYFISLNCFSEEKNIINELKKSIVVLNSTSEKYININNMILSEIRKNGNITPAFAKIAMKKIESIVRVKEVKEVKEVYSYEKYLLPSEANLEKKQ
jgi:hypothetical protein